MVTLLQIMRNLIDFLCGGVVDNVVFSLQHSINPTIQFEEYYTVFSFSDSYMKP